MTRAEVEELVAETAAAECVGCAEICHPDDVGHDGLCVVCWAEAKAIETGEVWS